ncbi:possible purine/pyrimidine phosphoribosyltransferase [Hydrogenimonas sp.]|nr:possible purine/pyrimidine phosphoribosyltransferase [Hydrogenimonas sp.]
MPICRECRNLCLAPKPKVRRLGSGLDVISFYSYDELEPFLLTKHHPQGWLVYKILAEDTFAIIEKAEGNSFVIPVDDDSSGGYSHTAVLAKSLKRKGYRPLWGGLRARNRLSYSGQPLSFRLQNSREFRYNGPKGIEAVLVDDIVTTGLTLQEAHAVLQNNDVTVICAFVLADVDR